MSILGKKQTKEHIQKRIQARRDNGTYTHSEATRLLFSKVFTGRRHTQEWKDALSKRMKENHPMRGKCHSLEAREKMSIAKKGKRQKRGEESPSWRGGKTAKAKIIRSSLEYKLWRESVFKRDDYTCQQCLVRGGELNADHIKPFSLFPELRLAIDNGVTLCRPCHMKTETFGSRVFTYQEGDNQI